MITEGKVILPNGKEATFGTPGSYSVGSDVYPCTVFGWTKSGKTLWVQNAGYRVVEGSAHNGTAVYECWPNALNPIRKVTWRAKSRTFRFKGWKHGSVSIGKFYAYQDPHF